MIFLPFQTKHQYRIGRGITKGIYWYGLLVGCLVMCMLSVAAQNGAKDGEWLFNGGDGGNTKYSSLDQIHRGNVAQLEIVWRWKAHNFGPYPETDYQVTPLMVNGVLYGTAGYRRTAMAINAVTGETLWTYRMDGGVRWRDAPRRNSGRGVAYWTDGVKERIFFITAGYFLVSLDAKTGIPQSDFGQNGIVDLKKGLDRYVDPIEAAIGATSPPIISHGVIVVGSALISGQRPRSMNNAPGHIRGYDVRTGKRLWIFHTIPHPGEFGNETWENESWRYTGNAGAWAPLSVDENLGYVYVPLEAATNDYYGGHRLGDNLFSESLVCLDIKTGKRIWHFQMTHHGLWDADLPAPPILTDVIVDGNPIKIVVQLTKQAFAFVFDRITGKPIWPIEERPVPQSDVPGDRLSPTQPFPTKPAPFDLQGLTIDDLIDFTPELRAEAIKIVSEYRIGPLYTPPSLKNASDGKKGTIFVPGNIGGANWQSGAVDIETGILYVTSWTNPAIAALVKSPESDMDFINDNWSLEGPQGLPLTKPPWGRITAIDLKTGNHLWMIPNGTTPEAVKNHPALRGVELPETGNKHLGSMLVTKTLLFVGANRHTYGEPLIRVLDKQTGKLIAIINLPALATGVPMTYMLNGKQYIVVAVGAQEHPGELIALTLPLR